MKKRLTTSKDIILFHGKRKLQYIEQASTERARSWSFLIEKELGIRLGTTRNGLVLGRPDIEAQKLCESFCGSIYYPSSLAENLEVERVLDIEVNDHWFSDDVWIRIVFNRTDHKWKDAGNIETNIVNIILNIIFKMETQKKVT